MAAFVGLLASPPALAAQPSAETLSNPEATLRWEGQRLDSGERDEFLLHVSLPPGVWGRPGALQIGIRWPYGDLDDGLWDLDLTVFGPDGKQAGSSAGGDEDAESVNVNAAQNGTYRVVVDAIDADPDEFAYEGMAQVERPPGASPLRDLLPDLAVRPHRRVTFSPTRVGVGQIPIPNFVNGCMADEIVEAGARRCLRFDQSIANVGDGVMELRYNLDDLGRGQKTYQRIHRSDGSVWERPAGPYEPHPTHLHLHYDSFALSKLWRSDGEGRRLDGDPLREGNKSGFCLIDVENFRFGEKGDAPRTYYGDGCARPETLLFEDNFHGISVGWADIYNWYLPDQYIEVSGVPDGFYLLETIADPGRMISELEEANNSHETLIRICGDRVDQVVPGSPGC